MWIVKLNTGMQRHITFILKTVDNLWKTDLEGSRRVLLLVGKMQLLYQNVHQMCSQEIPELL